jgi:anti-sigma factor RsiW
MRGPRHNDCPRKRLSSFLDGELSGEQAERLREHLARCPACRRELGRLQAVAKLLVRWDERAAGGLELAPPYLECLGARLAELPAAGPGGWAQPGYAGLLKTAGIAALLAMALAAAAFTGWLAGTRIRPALPEGAPGLAANGDSLPGASSLAETPEGSIGNAYVQMLAWEGPP